MQLMQNAKTCAQDRESVRCSRSNWVPPWSPQLAVKIGVVEIGNRSSPFFEIFADCPGPSITRQQSIDSFKIQLRTFTAYISSKIITRVYLPSRLYSGLP
jgi:hypothetical protein